VPILARNKTKQRGGFIPAFLLRKENILSHPEEHPFSVILRREQSILCHPEEPQAT